MTEQTEQQSRLSEKDIAIVADLMDRYQMTQAFSKKVLTALRLHPEIQHDPASLAVYCPLCGLQIAGLLAALKEMRAAMAATMRVIARHDDHDRLIEALSSELKSMGISDGFGVRSQQAIASFETRQEQGKP